MVVPAVIVISVFGIVSGIITHLVGGHVLTGPIVTGVALGCVTTSPPYPIDKLEEPVFIIEEDLRRGIVVRRKHLEMFDTCDSLFEEYFRVVKNA
jgi:hypothetical protein